MAETRRLAAVLAADVVGFSRMTGADEDRTLARLRTLRSDLIDPTIAVHNGHVFKRTGDGVLIEFRSVVGAVRCAIEVQNGMIERNAGLPPERRIEFRIGIHLGDVVEESDGDLMGDGVNIAARLEGVAKPNAICLSEDAYRQVRARLDLAFTDLGPTQLKNIAEPIRIYSLQATAPSGAKPAPPGLELPDKPSIAVLPFQNMSGDNEQEHFADGVVEDIITALSQFHELFVIARNSSFTYKGRAVDVRQVGRDLGVRYVLEGSVRKAANRVRITSQLIDATTGRHLWADRFDGEMADIFDLQDQVTTRVIGQIAPKVEQAEIERAKRKPTENLVAYDYYLRGMASFYRMTREDSDDSLKFYYRALELDPDFIAALSWASIAYTKRTQSNWMVDDKREIAEALRLARRAAELGQHHALALSTGGFTLAFLAGELDTGIALIDRALGLNPNLSTAWQASGWVRTFFGDPDTAIEHLAHAMRLSPLDRQMVQFWLATSLAMQCSGRYEESASWAGRVLQEQPNFVPALLGYAIGAALAGRLADAQIAMARALQIDPMLSLFGRPSVLSILRRPEDRSKLIEGLRLAGMPE
jgi:adenylate cyclase